MIATLPTQEQVDRIASGLAPDVVHIRFSTGRDWSEHPAFYFRVILSDKASRKERLRGCRPDSYVQEFPRTYVWLSWNISRTSGFVVRVNKPGSKKRHGVS